MSSQWSSKQRLRIGIVGRCINVPHLRGIGRYIVEILRGIGEESGVAWRVFANDKRYPVSVPPNFQGETDTFRFRGDRFELWEQLGVPLRGIEANCDIIHYTEGVMALWQPRASVITLHDTISWDQIPDRAFENFYYNRLMPSALRKAAAIITVSQSAKSDICKRWPDLADKVTVISHGIGSDFLSQGKQAAPSELQQSLRDTPYLVYLGGPLERKRFAWAAEALVACGMPQLHMVACGFSAEAAAAALAALPAGASGRVHIAPFLSDTEMVALYRGAAAVIYPTLYEGFGFPAIEAQASGVPVIFSPISSLKELVGPLTILASPHDMDDWTAAIRRAVGLGEERSALAEKSRAWVKAFSWDRSAQAHLEVYRSVALRATSPRREFQ